MSERRPGDIILDRYMPDATEVERENARENLYAFASVILRLCSRIAAERSTFDDSLRGDEGSTISKHP
jgi:hypothetical protein